MVPTHLDLLLEKILESWWSWALVHIQLRVELAHAVLVETFCLELSSLYVEELGYLLRLQMVSCKHEEHKLYVLVLLSQILFPQHHSNQIN